MHDFFHQNEFRGLFVHSASWWATHIEHSHWRGFIQVFLNDWFDHCRYIIKLHHDDDDADDDDDDGDDGADGADGDDGDDGDDDDDDDDVTIWVFESDLGLMSYCW